MNKVVFGESSGAGSVSLLPLISGTEGLFKRIIAESGSINLSYSPEETKKLTKLLLDSSDKSNMDELLSISEDEIKELNEDLNDYNNFPKRDGYILSGDLYDAYNIRKRKRY